jgi:hypothetical protein
MIPMQWGQTKFFEFCGDPNGPDEQFNTGMARVIRQLDIPDASIKVRTQAVADFLGYNQVITSGSARYISRGTPLPLIYTTTQPSGLPSQSYCIASIRTGTCLRGS